MKRMKGIDGYKEPECDHAENWLNELFDLMEETVSYLHSWCCTKDGEYKPVDYRGVKMAVISLLNGSVMASREESHNILDDFKDGVKNGSILVQASLFSIPGLKESELYERHVENVKLFEKKYSIKHEKNNK